MKNLIKYTSELFNSQALKPLANYRIIAHQNLNEPNIRMFDDIIDVGVDPKKVYFIPTSATYDKSQENEINKRGMQFVWDGWINDTTKYNQKHDKWSNCHDTGHYISADCNNAIHAYHNIFNKRFQNTLIMDSAGYLLMDVQNHARVTDYNKKNIFGISNTESEWNHRNYTPLIDIGRSLSKFKIINSNPQDELAAALTLAGIYSFFRNAYEVDTISELAKYNPTIKVPERFDKLKPQKLDLDIEDKIITEYRRLHKE